MKLRTIIPFQYDHIHYLDKNTYSVILDNKAAIIDLHGNMLVPFHSDRYELARKALSVIQPLHDNFPFVTYSSNGPNSSFYPGDYFFLRDDSWIVLQEEIRNGRTGVVDNSGNVIVPFEYAYVAIFSDGTIRASDNKGHDLLFDYHGKQLFSTPYRNIYKTGDYFAVCSQDNLNYGVLDAKGNTVLPFEFDELDNTGLPDGFVIPKNYNKPAIGVFCVKGEWKWLHTGLQAMMYGLEDDTANDPRLYIRQLDRHWLADYGGNKWELPEMYYNACRCGRFVQVSRPESFEGYIPFVSNPKSGIIDVFGNVVIQVIYDNIIVFGDDKPIRYFPVCINSLWGLIDEQNNIVIAPGYAEMLPCYSGTVPVSDGEKWGLIQPSGKIILDCKYEMIGNRSSSHRRGPEYYANNHVLAGKVIPVYLDRNGCFALTDLNGHFLSDFGFEKVHPYRSLHEDRLLLRRNGKWGVIQITAD